MCAFYQRRQSFLQLRILDEDDHFGDRWILIQNITDPRLKTKLLLAIGMDTMIAGGG